MKTFVTRIITTAILTTGLVAGAANADTIQNGYITLAQKAESNQSNFRSYGEQKPFSQYKFGHNDQYRDRDHAYSNEHNYKNYWNGYDDNNHSNDNDQAFANKDYDYKRGLLYQLFR